MDFNTFHSARPLNRVSRAPVLRRIVVIGGLSLTLVACGGGGGGGSGDGGGSGNTRPTASFNATPTSGTAPLQVAFDGSASTDPDGSISSYQWTFGDGSSGTGANTQHTYASAGSYSATLTVTDNKGATGTASRSIAVSQPTGSVAVSAKDSSGIAVPGVLVSVAVGGTTKTGTTGAAGTVTVTDVPTGTGTVSVSRDTFVSASKAVTVTLNQTSSLDFVLERIQKAVGGVLTTSDPISVPVGTDGKTLEFTIRVVVVDEFSNAIPGLTGAAFTLQPCTPSATTNAADCVTTSGANQTDAAYAVVPPGTPLTFESLPPENDPPVPYAAALMFDQSQSITVNDATDARLFSAKEFLGSLGGSQAALVAFASDKTNTAALIPEKPVTIYPLGAPKFVSDGTTLFPTLDSLANLEGGGTPLYEALCRVMDFTNTEITSAGSRKAAVVFTDGQNDVDNNIGYACTNIDAAIAKHDATGVDIFTIGLSGEVDGRALAELAERGGGTFLFAEDTTQLITIYGSLGNLLSGSLATYRLKYRISTDAANTFVPGRSVLGTLSVNTGTLVVNLPFIVRIF
jgi:PKD repeat protein